ncbi:MAG: hypothetical protein MI725_13065 [Pirellulales bacterium]|nr:hypothetical protein [Pirellulales bacterium]
MRLSKLRQQLAWEAARFIHEQPDLRYSDARQLAAERLCPTGVHRRDVPTDEEVSLQLRALKTTGTALAWEHRFERYLELLQPLAYVHLDPARHPEGDALYHSLQVFTLAHDRLPYDEEFLTAALLHEVGRVVDRRNPIAAGLVLLGSLITPRTSWLIENLPYAVQLRVGSLGARARRRLENSEDFDELLLLAECDKQGRKLGVKVPDVEDAVQQLRQMSESYEG